MKGYLSKAKRFYFGVSSALTVSGVASVAFADATIGQVIGKIIDIILTFFKYVGIVVLVWGIGSFIVGMRNDDIDSKQKSIYTIIIGVVLTTLGLLAGPIIQLIDPSVVNSSNLTN